MKIFNRVLQGLFFKGLDPYSLIQYKALSTFSLCTDFSSFSLLRRSLRKSRNIDSLSRILSMPLKRSSFPYLAAKSLNDDLLKKKKNDNNEKQKLQDVKCCSFLAGLKWQILTAILTLCHILNLAPRKTNRIPAILPGLVTEQPFTRRTTWNTSFWPAHMMT